ILCNPAKKPEKTAKTTADPLLCMMDILMDPNPAITAHIINNIFTYIISLKCSSNFIKLLLLEFHEILFTRNISTKHLGQEIIFSKIQNFIIQSTRKIDISKIQQNGNIPCVHRICRY